MYELGSCGMQAVRRGGQLIGACAVGSILNSGSSLGLHLLSYKRGKHNLSVPSLSVPCFSMPEATNWSAEGSQVVSHGS